ncbi:phosphatidate cytidylyltransferase [Pelagibacteraceae bacterium]|nr:phosphatidate cytidylyltransferase [Pelagibacteraceae bacterium]
MISKNLKSRIYTSLSLLILIALIAKFNVISVFSLIVLGVFSLIEFFEIQKKIFKNKYYIYLFAIIFSTYVFIFCIAFYYFLNIYELKIILFALLFTCIASDVGGYFFGRMLKGPKLTKISPNKTISGAIGSIFFSSLIFSIFVFYSTNNFNFKILVISSITSLGCQIGDLFFSYLKRKAKLKDTGKFFPGHGGVLDRLDGIFLGVPIGFISLVQLY